VNAWKIVLITAVIYGAGFVSGGALNRANKTLLPSRPRTIERTALPPAMTARRQAEYLARLNRELQLTPQQFDRIQAILQESNARTQQLWESIQPQWRDETRATRQKIRAELDPRQQRRLTEISKRPKPDDNSPPRRRLEN
jgi:hypothetical protein